MFNGRITRVRMDAEGSTIQDVERALGEGFGVVFHSVVQAVEAGALRSDSGLIFSRESEFGEVVIESKVRDEGAIFFVGRQVVKFNEVLEPMPPPMPLTDDADRAIETLRSWPGVGIGIRPLIASTPDGSKWGISVAGPAGEDFEVEGKTLEQAARKALAFLAHLPVEVG